MLSKRRNPGSGSHSKKINMSKLMVSKQLMDRLEKINKMILPLYIQVLQMLHPKKKVDMKFVREYSVKFINQELELKSKNISNQIGGKRGITYFKRHWGDRQKTQRWRRNGPPTPQNVKDNHAFFMKSLFGLCFFLIIHKLLFY